MKIMTYSRYITCSKNVFRLQLTPDYMQVEKAVISPALPLEAACSASHYRL